MTTDQITYESVARDEDIDPEAFELFCKNQHIKEEGCEEAVLDFCDAYISYFDSPREFIQEYLWEGETFASIGNIYAILNHIDWVSLWDAEYRHDYYELDGYYFRNI